MGDCGIEYKCKDIVTTNGRTLLVDREINKLESPRPKNLERMKKGRGDAL